MKGMSWVGSAVLMGAFLMIWPGALRAQEAPPAEGAPDQAVETETPAPDTTKQTSTPSTPARSRGWGTRLETEPPGYVKTANQLGLEGLEGLNWLEFGLETRTRFEYRSDYRRADFQNDEQILSRTRVYLGIREVLDPLRLGLEFQDARQCHSDFPDRDRDVDQADLLQAFAELYFADALAQEYPLQFRAGRMTLEYVDRRLVGRNRWRNTTNSFEGFRLRLGEPQSPAQLDVFAVQPVERRMRQHDRGDEERWFYGVVGAWRGWSDWMTLEPYYFVLDEDRKDPAQADREIHTVGLHLFGPIPNTRFDYDFDSAYQFGDDGANDQRAWALYSELGYTFDHAWKPRLSLSGTCASGDRTPNDDRSNRFDRLFQVGHPYSMSDLFSWQNTLSPKVRLELKPTSKARVTASYGGYWLAQEKDAWVITGRRDRTGSSGDFIGQEVELQLRYQLNPRLELEAGYSHFFPGSFADNTGPLDDGDLFYLQTTFSF